MYSDVTLTSVRCRIVTYTEALVEKKSDVEKLTVIAVVSRSTSVVWRPSDTRTGSDVKFDLRSTTKASPCSGHRRLLELLANDLPVDYVDLCKKESNKSKTCTCVCGAYVVVRPVRRDGELRCFFFDYHPTELCIGQHTIQRRTYR